MDSVALSHCAGSLLAEPPEQQRPALAHLGGSADRPPPRADDGAAPRGAGLGYLGWPRSAVVLPQVLSAHGSHKNCSRFDHEAARTR